MSDIFLRTRIFTDTSLANPDTWSLSIEVASGTQVDDVLSAALLTSGLAGTYQVSSLEGPLRLHKPVRVSFDLMVTDLDCDQLAEMTLLEMTQFLSLGCAEVLRGFISAPSMTPQCSAP